MGSPLGSPDDVATTGRAVQKMFASVAPRYDFLNHCLSLGLDLTWRRATAKALRDAVSQAGSVAADVCCGTGDLTLALSRFSAGTVIGTDFCYPMLQRAEGKLSRSALRNGGARPRCAVLFVEADTLSLPFSDRSLDLVTSAFGFRNLANYAMGLREMLRVLKPGGTIAILEFSRVQWPVFGPVFRFYFAALLPRIGDWVSGVRGPYRYLHHSASQFPDQEALAVSMAAAGFTNVRYRNFVGGVAALHLGEKAIAEKV
jgi:demethylmenaquinone methyltransferase / 2-methoxy-6-polyprenyl-1,4-benzoquinol methylase